MKRGLAETYVREVRKVVANWQGYADDAGVLPEFNKTILDNLRLDF
jgi:hypothetical protein